MDITVTGDDISKKVREGIEKLSKKMDMHPFYSTEGAKRALDDIFKGASVTFWMANAFSEKIEKYAKEAGREYNDTIYTLILEELLQVLCLTGSCCDINALVELARFMKKMKLEIMLKSIKEKL